MYLNNSKINLNVCNGTIGIITDVDNETNSVRVSFNISGGIIDMNVKPDTNYFIINCTAAKLLGSKYYIFLFILIL